MTQEVTACVPTTLPVLAQAFQHLWLVQLNDGLRAFAYADRTMNPSPVPSWC
jgi:hypothetical protein